MPKISFELTPKKSGDYAKVLRSIEPHLGELEFVSVTCTKRDFFLTLDMCQELMHEGHVVAAHVLCGEKSRDEMKENIARLCDAGITKVIALRGDHTKAGSIGTDEFISMLRDDGSFDEICVAGYPSGHPESTDMESDLGFLVKKIKAGATRVITQVCYEPDKIVALRDGIRRHGQDTPVSAGILPVRNYERMMDFAQRCGAKVPQSLCDRFEAAPEEKRRKLAMALLDDLSEKVIAGGLDLHYYTLNSMSMIRENLVHLKELAGA